MYDLPKNLIRDQRIEPAQLAADETIFAQSNGILGIRGTMAEGTGMPSDDPYALINGFYNTLPYHYEENSIHFPQHGQTIVKLMSASAITIQTREGVLNLSSAELTDLRREYVLSEGLTRRSATYRLPSGQSLTIHEERFVPQTPKHLVVTHIQLESSDYQGDLHITSHLNLPKVFKTITHDPRLQSSNQHLLLVKRHLETDYASLEAITTGTKQLVAAAYTHVPNFRFMESDNGVTATRSFDMTPGQSIQFSSFQIYDTALTNPQRIPVKKLVEQLETYDVLKAKQHAWAEHFWAQNQVHLSDPERLLELQYAMFQLNASGGEQEHLQIAAKGLSGVGYEGHYFWDTEIYMVPYFILTQPEKAKRLLMVRYHHLEASRKEARKLGVTRGIKIPWRTINGEETSPYYPAGSAQIHINSDVAYTIMRYFYATNDVAFMVDYGDELVLETALFILDYGVFHDGQFHLNTVTGPDEYTALVNDNYYTNAMAKRHFESVLELAGLHASTFMAMCQRIGVDPSVLVELRRAAEHMCLLRDEASNVIAQDDSFFRKKPLDLANIPANHHPMLLHYHPLFIYRHQVLKQSDAVLAMILLDHPVDDTYRQTFYYYLERTTHDSSLSKCIYGIAAFALGLVDLGHDFLMDSLEIDLKDTKNHTQHGLHMANMGGTFLLVSYGLLGLRIGKVLQVAPVYQSIYPSLGLKIKYQGTNIKLAVTNNRFRIDTDRPVWIEVYGERRYVESFIEVVIKTT